MSPDTLTTIKATVSNSWQKRQLLNPEYLYSTKPRQESLSQKLWNAVIEWLSELGDTNYDGIGDLIGYALIVGVIVIGVMLIVRSSKQGVFEGAGRGVASVKEEELEPVQDLDRQIGEAVAGANYRLAIRLLFRRTIADMRDRQLIIYRPEKTDAQYVREIRSLPVHGPFSRAVVLFHHAWYGMEDVDLVKYQEASNAFNTVRSLLAQQQ